MIDEKMNADVQPANQTEPSQVEGTVEDSGASSKQTTNVITAITNKMSSEVAKLVRTSDAKQTKEMVSDMLRTVFNVNSLDEYAVGVRVNGELYRFDEYQIPTGMLRLVTASKVVVRDTASANDFLERKKFYQPGKMLTPGEMITTSRVIFSRLRIQPNLTTLSRPSLELLQDAAAYAVVGTRTADAKYEKLYFLTLTVDSEQNIPINEWTKRVSLKLFE